MTLNSINKPVAYYGDVVFDEYEITDADGTGVEVVWAAYCDNVRHPMFGRVASVRTSRLVTAPHPDYFETLNTKYVRSN